MLNVFFINEVIMLNYQEQMFTFKINLSYQFA